MTVCIALLIEERNTSLYQFAFRVPKIDRDCSPVYAPTPNRELILESPERPCHLGISLYTLAIAKNNFCQSCLTCLGKTDRGSLYIAENRSCLTTSGDSLSLHW